MAAAALSRRDADDDRAAASCCWRRPMAALRVWAAAVLLLCATGSLADESGSGQGSCDLKLRAGPYKGQPGERLALVLSRLPKVGLLPPFVARCCFCEGRINALRLEGRCSAALLPATLQLVQEAPQLSVGTRRAALVFSEVLREESSAARAYSSCPSRHCPLPDASPVPMHPLLLPSPFPRPRLS